MTVERGQENLAAGTALEAGTRALDDRILEHLLARVARGDHDAFASLYHHTASLVYGHSGGSALSWIVSIARRQAARRFQTADGDGRETRHVAEPVMAIPERAGKRLPAGLVPGGRPHSMTECNKLHLFITQSS